MNDTASPWLTSGNTGFHPQLLPDHSEFWYIPAALFVSFTLLVILRVFDGRRMNRLLGGFFRIASLGLLYREESMLLGRPALFLLINYLLNATLFVALSYNYIRNISIAVFLQIAGLLIAIYLIKLISTRVIGSIFGWKEQANEYIYAILLSNKVLGIVLFPITLLLAFSHQIPEEWLIYAGLTFWAIFLIYRVLRSTMVVLSAQGVSLYYLFIYLCTLEIIPFVVLMKLFIGNF